MKKKLPQVKKKFISFIKEEDAKVIDQTASKIAIIGSISALNFLINAEEVNAKGHCNHSNHANLVKTHTDDPRLLNTDENDLSFQLINVETGIQVCGRRPTFSTQTITMPGKSVGAVHANHFNHINYKKGLF